MWCCCGNPCLGGGTPPGWKGGGAFLGFVPLGRLFCPATLTQILRSMTRKPSKFWMAALAASAEENLTNPKPLGSPVFLSVMILASTTFAGARNKHRLSVVV